MEKRLRFNGSALFVLCIVHIPVVGIFRWYCNGLDEVDHGAQKAVYSVFFGLETEGLDTYEYFKLELDAVGLAHGPLHGVH